jgi:F-type H+-transporting ATPase subunit epsilon
MAKGELELKIVSLKEVVYNDFVDSVTLPTTTGEITVLPHHAGLISELKSGAIRARSGSGEKKFPIAGGFLEVESQSRLTLLIS